MQRPGVSEPNVDGNHLTLTMNHGSGSSDLEYVTGQ